MIFSKKDARRMEDEILNMLQPHLDDIQARFLEKESLRQEDIFVLLLKSQYNHINHIDDEQTIIRHEQQAFFETMDQRFIRFTTDINQKFDAFTKKIELKLLVIDNHGQELTNFKDNFKNIDLRFDEIDKKFIEIDRKFVEIDKKFELIDLRFDEIDKKFEIIDRRFAEMDFKIELYHKEMKAFILEQINTHSKQYMAFTTVIFTLMVFVLKVL